MQHFEKHEQPLRLAIDISIWNFQTQSGKGGQNPVLRTLYYRLLRLLSLAITPLFVFDGPNKPPFKRNKKIGHNVASLPDFLTRQLLKQFGFPFHTAPGEAEAECALLQQKGVVDVVLSEDVDTLMFGCGTTIRNWSSEGSPGNKSPTHVNLYQAEVTKEKSGLDSDGMILVALMSGGDYVPAGVPGCGVKIACEAARAGFGRDLRKIAKNDTAGYQEWRDRLEHELHTNESGHFRTRHGALVVPKSFPDRKVLAYYTHPTVSGLEKFSQLSVSIAQPKPINIQELRTFVAEAFEWLNLSGALKFIRGLAPALLIHRLQVKASDSADETNYVADTEKEESRLIKAICGRRNHFVTDGLPELRLAYIPRDIVGLNLELEERDEPTREMSSDSEVELVEENERSEVPTSPEKVRGPFRYEPNKPEKLWVLETWAKVGVPMLVETWEGEQRNPQKFATRKARERKQTSKAGMQYGALDAFVKITKPNIPHEPSSKPSSTSVTSLGETATSASTLDNLPSVQPAEKVKHIEEKTNIRIPLMRKETILPDMTPPIHSRSHWSTKKKWKQPLNGSLTNPWTLSRRPSDTLDVNLPAGTRYSALGIYASGSKDDAGVDDETVLEENRENKATEPLDIFSSVQKKPTTPLGDSPLGGNVTIRRKRRAKPLTKAVTAPCGIREIIDLDDSDEDLMGVPLQVPDIAGLPRGQTSEPSALPCMKDYQKPSARGPRHFQAKRGDSCPDETDLGLRTPPPPASPTSSLNLPSLADQHSRNPGIIMLRESLEGAWRILEPTERLEKSARVFSSVGIVDLTAD